MPRLVASVWFWVWGGVVLLALVSALLLWLVPRWVDLPDTVLADPDFAAFASEAPVAAWQRVGGGKVEAIDGGVRLANDDPDAVIGIDQVIALPSGGHGVRVTATVTLRDVVAGPERWQRPRVVVQGVTPDGRADIGGRFQLIDRVGDVGPVRLSAVFPVASPSDQARVMLRLHRTTGVMEVRDLEVAAAFRPATRDLLRRGLIVLWLGIGAAIGLALWWQSQNRLAATLVLAGLGSLALVVVLPQSVRQPLHDLLNAVTGERSIEVLKPLLHLSGFAVLAFASRLAQPHRPLWLFVSAWLAAAVLLELAELYFSMFDADDFVDMAFNAAGAMLGLAVAGHVLRRRGRAATPDPAKAPGRPEIPEREAASALMRRP